MKEHRNFQFAILYHNYYSMDGLVEIRDKLHQFGSGKPLLLVSVAEKLSLEHKIRNTVDEKYVVSANVGKDIGGKLLLIDLAMRLFSDVPFWIFVHDKKSYQKSSGNFEKNRLHAILEKENFDKIDHIFSKEQSTGLICAKEFIKNEFDNKSKTFRTANQGKIVKLMNQYNIHPPTFDFAAGTMFAVRSSVYKSFFSTYNPISIRSTLEDGNALDHDKGTNTHTWERLLSWIVTAQGYKLKGI